MFTSNKTPGQQPKPSVNATLSSASKRRGKSQLQYGWLVFCDHGLDFREKSYSNRNARTSSSSSASLGSITVLHHHGHHHNHEHHRHHSRFERKAVTTDLFRQARRDVRQQRARVEVGQEPLVQVLRPIVRPGVNQLPIRQRPERRVANAVARHVAQQQRRHRSHLHNECSRGRYRRMQLSVRYYALTDCLHGIAPTRWVLHELGENTSAKLRTISYCSLTAYAKLCPAPGMKSTQAGGNWPRSAARSNVRSGSRRSRQAGEQERAENRTKRTRC